MAILQYRSSDAKFVARTEIVTTTGTLTLNAGSFLGVLNGNGNSDKKEVQRQQLDTLKLGELGIYLWNRNTR